MRQSDSRVEPKQEPVHVFPRGGGLDDSRVTEVAIQEALSVVFPERALDYVTGLLREPFAVLAHAVCAWIPDCSSDTISVAAAEASSGGTALPTCRYRECAAPPSIRPHSGPRRGSVLNTNR